MNFNTLGVAPQIVATLETLNITTPTPVQEQAIPQALQGKDVLVSAQTGTGKTYAYLIPVIMRLLEDQNAKALIIAPTRELALQIQQNLRALPMRELRLKSAMLIGGQSIVPQLRDLRSNPRIVIGTPGRINDHLDRRTLLLDKTSMLVLDEFDRMLDMGFEMQLDTIREMLPEKRQTLMFSATVPNNVSKLIVKYTQDPFRIEIGGRNEATENVKQEILKTSIKDKFDQLLTQLQEREGSAIIFVRTKMKAEELSERLQDENHKASAMHGDLRQQKRERVIQAFRNQKQRIMVATDVAARGIDVPHVQHVINYDLPECPEDYVHRIGRAGRAGAKGFALSFVCPQDNFKWAGIYKLMNMQKNPDFAHLAPEGRAAEGEQRRSRFGGNRRSSGFGSRSGGGKFSSRRGSNDRFSRDDNRSGRSFKSRDGESSERSFRSRDDEKSSGSRSFGGFKRGEGDKSRSRSDRFSKDSSRPSSSGRFKKSNDSRPERSEGSVFRSESFKSEMKPSDKPRGGSFRSGGGRSSGGKRFSRPSSR